MRLTYSILWFDDDEEYLESVDLDYIRTEFSKWGFNCELNLVHDKSEFDNAAPYQDYDLILVDYSLESVEDGLYGQDFIKKVREQQLLTDVIFYSSHAISHLWDAIRKEKLEGIFIASRNNGINDKLLRVAKQSIHKILDLENLRGIVMAEVGNNDEYLKKIAKKSFEGLPEIGQKELFQSYVNKISDQSDNHLQKLENAVNKSNFDELFCLFDSAKKWNFCQSLAKVVPDLKIKDQGDYMADVLKKRNFLAHGIPIKQDDKSLKFNHMGKEYIFDDVESELIRVSLTKYAALFKRLAIGE